MQFDLHVGNIILGVGDRIVAIGSYRVLTEAEHHIIRTREHNLKASGQNVLADKVMATSGEEFSKGATGSNLNLAYSSQVRTTQHCDLSVCGSIEFLFRLGAYCSPSCLPTPKPYL